MQTSDKGVQPLYVTAAMLRKRRACEGQVELFEQVFGRRAKVLLTRENWDKARLAGLQTWWPAREFLRGNGFAIAPIFGRSYECENPQLYLTDKQSDHNLCWAALQRARKHLARIGGAA